MGPHESSMSPDESNMSLQADDGVLGDGVISRPAGGQMSVCGRGPACTGWRSIAEHGARRANEHQRGRAAEPQQRVDGS